MSDCVFGIDPSLSGTAVCAYRQDGTFEMKRFGTPPANGKTIIDRNIRYGALIELVAGLVNIWRPEAVLIEGYSFASKGNAILTMVEFGWSLRENLLGYCNPLEVPPATLKQFATGKGNADKLAVCLAIQKRYGVDFTTSDEFDAYALARIAACHVGWDEPANDTQRAALAALRGEKPKKRPSRIAKS